MTKQQITKKLNAAGIDMAHIVEIKTNEVTVAVMSEHTPGVADTAKTNRLQSKVAKLLGFKNGVRYGWGAWCLEGHSNGAEARRSNELDQFGPAAY